MQKKVIVRPFLAGNPDFKMVGWKIKGKGWKVKFKGERRKLTFYQKIVKSEEKDLAAFTII